jgi:hypothetical protein
MNQGLAGSNHWTAAVPLFLQAGGGLYSFLFGWLDRRAAQESERRLLQEVESSFSFLFSVYGGRIVPNQGVTFPLPFDGACLTVGVGGMFVRFTRCRGTVTVQVAAENTTSPSEWHDLLLVLDALHPSRVRRKALHTLHQAARSLEPCMNALQEAFATGRFQEIKDRLENEVYKEDRAQIAAWNEQINTGPRRRI